MIGKFIDGERFFNLLKEQGVSEILQVDANEEFRAECVFLNSWCESIGNEPEGEGLDEFSAAHDHNEKTDTDQVYVDIVYDSDHITMVYTIDRNHPHKYNYALEIYYNDNVMYERTADQEPTTEWNTNAMANDVQDENGNFYFVGEPINI